MQTVDRSTTKLDHGSFRVCWVTKLDVECPECHRPIPGSSIEEILPDEFILSEGAKVMRSRNPHRLNQTSGSAAAKKRWDKVRESESKKK